MGFLEIQAIGTGDLPQECHRIETKNSNTVIEVVPDDGNKLLQHLRVAEIEIYLVVAERAPHMLCTICRLYFLQQWRGTGSHHLRQVIIRRCRKKIVPAGVSSLEEVAVKVLRPRIEQAFRRDIDAFYFAARMIEVVSPGSRRLRPMDVVEHFEGVVMGELDLRLETAGAAEFAKNTAKDEGFQVPDVKWDMSSRRVMTLEWVDGVPLGDVPAIEAANHDKVRLAEKVMTTFLSHALRDGYFHADMHQGNLKVAADGTLVALDFGIMGRIDAYTRRVYAEILIGFIRKDYQRVAEVHFEAGYVPADRNVDDFARALRAVGEPIFGMDASRISMARLLSYLFEVTERFGMETRTELILLQRTMVVVEGVARSLDPHVNIWSVARPTVESYITENIGPKALIRDLAQTARVLARFGPKLPQIAEAA